MQDLSVAFATPADATRWKRWLVYSPGARFVCFAAIFIGLVLFLRLGLAMMGWVGPHASPRALAAVGFVYEIVPALLAYLFVVRAIEDRYPVELAPEALPRFGLAGFLAGSALFSAVVAVLWLAGSYHIVGSHAHPDWIPQVVFVGLGAGLGEEIVTRGALFRMAEEGLGTWAALAISAIVFGALHIGNPGATLWSSAAIAIEAGLLLGMIYHVTRSLWACAGLHAAWNIMQGVVYGIPVSGTPVDGFLVSTRTGPDWLSGGQFGAEASVVALGLCSVCTIGLICVALRRGSIVPPFWQREPAATADPWDRLDRIR